MWMSMINNASYWLIKVLCIYGHNPVWDVTNWKIDFISAIKPLSGDSCCLRYSLDGAV